MEVTVLLQDSAKVRNRKVYDIITLIAEVTGFADILILSATVIVGFLYQPQMLEAKLIEHMSRVNLPQSSNFKSHKKDLN